MRSLGYDLRRSKRFRRIGTMAVATMAGGVIAAGTLLQGDQVPGIPALGDGDDADIIDGWFGIGAETAEQEAESSGAESTAPSRDAAGADGESASAEPESRSRGGSSPAGSPGLVPIGGGEPSEPSHEESGTVSPSPTVEPTDEPTTEVPTTAVPTTEAPTTDEPSPSESGALAEQAPRGFIAPTPQKGPIGG
jgi:hypothetical protein